MKNLNVMNEQETKEVLRCTHEYIFSKAGWQNIKNGNNVEYILT